jgi:nanoRNase/pAp phosphatase (c-di-AMP/oligoRNAs hydrolase)
LTADSTDQAAQQAERLAGLLDAVEDGERVLILTHDNPDPDALASAAALSFLLERTASVQTTVALGGIVGRAENRNLVLELGLEYQRIEQLDTLHTTLIALVDTQPRAGNNSLPAGRIASVVIDHHPPRPETTAATFVDIRPDYGASCSMLVEYLRMADLEPAPELATALFYGIQSETMDLGREASEADVAASVWLYPRCDPAAVARIRHARVPASYFRSMHEALAVAQRYNNVVTIPLKTLPYPDMVAEMADLFMQMAGVEWTIALGRYRDQLLFSVRTYQSDAHAGSLAQHAVGERGSAGGHGSLAGGQMDVRKMTEAEEAAVRDELLQALLAQLGAANIVPLPLVDRAEGGGEEGQA